MGPNFEFKNISRTWKKYHYYFDCTLFPRQKRSSVKNENFLSFLLFFSLHGGSGGEAEKGDIEVSIFHPSENGKRNKEPFLLHCGRKKGNVPRRVGNLVRAPKEVFRNVQQGCKCEKVAHSGFVQILFSLKVW